MVEMGYYLVQRYKKIPKPQKIAFYSAFILCLLIHLYKFTNTLLNHDSVYNFYSDQNVLGSGRWFLSIACGFSSFYDLPWVNGLLSILYIALTAAVITALFRIENPIVILLTSGLLAAFPGTTETFFFEFTADGYMLAMLLAALGVYFSRLGAVAPSKLLLSSVCICLCCGIYQAFVSFALVLAVCHLIYELFENRYDTKTLLRWVISQVLIYAVAMIAYYLIWKIYMRVQGVSANDYQGISDAASFHLNSPISALFAAIQSFLLIFLQWNVLEHGFTPYSILNILFLVSLTGILIYAVVKSKLYQRRIPFLLFCLCLVSLVPFTYLWYFVSGDVQYRPMMQLSIALLYILAALLFDRWASVKWSNLAGLLLAVIVFNNSLIANISYYYMHQCNDRTFAESIEMMIRIRQFQAEEDIEQIAIVGSRIFDVQLIPWNDSTNKQTEAASVFLICGGLENSLLYDGEHIRLYLTKIHGLDTPIVSQTEANLLAQNSTIQEMPNWPADGSMQVIESTLVIKIGDNTFRSEDN